MHRDFLPQLASDFADGRHRDVVTRAARFLDEHQEFLAAARIAEVHRYRGLAAHELGDVGAAIRSLHHAFRWDPTDRRVGIALGRLLLEQGDESTAWDVLENVLVHHGGALLPRARAELAYQLAASYQRSGNAMAARRHLEALGSAIHRVPHAESLLADVLGTTGERARAIALRRRVLAATEDIILRARLALRLAEDLRHDGRDQDAADTLESVAGAFNAVLDEDPTAVERFEDQVRLLTAAESWTALHAAYLMMIQRISALNRDDSYATLALLWRKMGDVSEARLGLHERAQEEYATAEGHRVHAERSVYTRTGTHEAVGHLDSLWEDVIAAPNDLDVVTTYGNALLGRNDRHYGHTVLAVGSALAEGPTDRDPAASWSGERFRVPLTDELRTQFLRPRERRATLDAIFHVGCRIAGHLFIAPDGRQLDARNRIESNRRRPVVLLFEEISADLGFTSPPTLYAARGTTGLRSATTLAPSFLIGDDVIQAADTPELRFQIGQLLTMSLPRFVLATSMNAAQLGDIVFALTGVSVPEYAHCNPRLIERVRAIAAEGMADRWQSALDGAIARLAESEVPSVNEWLGWASAEAARTGLLCAGDVATALEAVKRYPVVADQHGADAQHARLALYAMSPEFDQLKRELGLGR